VTALISNSSTSGAASKIALELQAQLGKRKVLTQKAERAMYRHDAILVGQTPIAVVLPETTQDVIEAVLWAKRHGLPIVGRGAASGLSGGAVPTAEGLVIAFTRMTKLELRPEKREVWVEPGVVTLKISELAKPHGLVYPPDPASFRTSTIGGNIAENAGGPMCFKKGVTGDYVKELEFVDHDGELHHLKRDAYDLAGLLIGSEGTLGLITGALLRLEPPAKFTRTLMAHFPEVGQAAEAVSKAIAGGAVPSKLEFMDKSCTQAVEDYLHLGLPVHAGAVLLVDTDGDDLELVNEELELVRAACLGAGGEVRVAADASESESLWKARRSVSPSLGRIRPQRMNEDIVVPRSVLPQVVREIEALGIAAGLPLVQFGHIGDGNLHPNILFDPKLDSFEAVEILAHEIARVAIRHGGVLSGEHGIGLSKREFMCEAVDADTLAALWRVKNSFDPNSRLNPGKILPEMDTVPDPKLGGSSAGH
jgi:glycolate oxidase